MASRKISSPPPPALPVAPTDYARVYHDQYSNVLRLYFSQLFSTLKSLLGRAGAKYINAPYGAFFDTTDQISSNVAVASVITFSNTAYTNEVVLISSSNVTVQNDGIYNIQYSCQLVNTTNDTQNVDIWFRKNGSDIPDSNSRFGLAPRKSTGDSFHTIGAINFFCNLSANDYVQLAWATSDVGAYLEYYPAPTGPTRPAIPSVILTVTFVSSL